MLAGERADDRNLAPLAPAGSKTSEDAEDKAQNRKGRVAENDDAVEKKRLQGVERDKLGLIFFKKL